MVVAQLQSSHILKSKDRGFESVRCWIGFFSSSPFSLYRSSYTSGGSIKKTSLGGESLADTFLLLACSGFISSLPEMDRSMDLTWQFPLNSIQFQYLKPCQQHQDLRTQLNVAILKFNNLVDKLGKIKWK